MTTAEIDLHRLELAYADLRVVDRRGVARLAADLATEGQHQPVLVVPRGDRLVLIDGYCRVAALRRLGRDTVMALTLSMPERDALLFAHRTGSGRRRFALEDGWLFQELVERFSLKQTELAELLGRSESFVSRRLALVVHLPDSVQKAVRDGRIGAHGAQRSVVPLARANREHAERLVANLGGLRPTTRQLATLYLAWRVGDAETRERIVDHPELFLKAQDAEPPREVDAVTDLVRAIETISGACHGARKRLRAFALHQLDTGGREAITRAFGEAALAFGSVRTLLAEEGLDA
jgi:ParB/RepB/Spo0J family partition protein